MTFRFSPWNKRRLGDVAEVVTGSTPSKENASYYDGEIPFVTPAELGDHDIVSSATTTLSVAGAAQARILPKDTILVCCIGSLGKVGIAGRQLATNQQINALIFDNNIIYPRFGYYVARKLKPTLEAMAPATTIAIVNKSRFSDLEIPVPPLEEQKRIAAILDKADAIRRKRQQAIQLADEFLRSVFLEMFGDPVKNPKGWEVRPIHEISTRVTKGESPKWQGFDYQSSGIRFITSENVLWGKLDDRYKFIPAEFNKKIVRSSLCENDLLVNLVGASVGRACLVTKESLPANINQAVSVITMNDKILLPEIALQQVLLPSIQRILLGNIVDAARANISLANIRDLELAVPPITEQFKILKAINKIKAVVSKQKAASEFTLFESLSQRAFAGSE